MFCETKYIDSASASDFVRIAGDSNNKIISWQARPDLWENTRQLVHTETAQLRADGFFVVHERCFDQFGGISRLVRDAVASTTNDDNITTNTWQSGNSTHCIISGAAAATTSEAIFLANAALEKVGFCFSDVVRTWFYIDNILARYDKFNLDRIAAYKMLGVSVSSSTNSTCLPASTGVGMKLNGDGPYFLEVYAVKDAPVEFLTSRVQKEAFLYGSAFSRGAKISCGSESLVSLSGTAAIDEQGNSLYENDFESQMRCTFEKIDALLRGQGGSMENLLGGCAFIKRGQDMAQYHRFISTNHLDHLPLVPVIADICRSELLFEIDGELLINTQ